jgi:glutathione S-transferase
MDFSELKKDPFESLNPNGRVPAIEDPNTGITLWESGAIIEYLLETYDKENKLSYTKSPEKFQQLCWLHFQMSGQGMLLQRTGRSCIGFRH